MELDVQTKQGAVHPNVIERIKMSEMNKKRTRPVPPRLKR